MRPRLTGTAARRALVATGLVVSGAFAYLAVRDVRAAETWDAFRTTGYGWLAPALALLVAAFFVRAIRWWALFEPSRRPPLGAAVRATFVGYLANNLLPARAGEAAKAITLNRLSRTPVVEAAGTIVLERIYDVLSLVLLLFLMLPALPAVTWVRSAAILGAVLLVAAAALALAVMRFGEAPLRIVLRPLARVPGMPQAFLERAPQELVQGLAGIVRPRLAAVAFAWTTASWIVVGLSYWLVMNAFDLGLSPLAGELVVIAIGLAMILPSSPAALGVFEAATIAVLDAYGVDKSLALSYALLLHALNVLPLVAVAGGALVARRLRPRPPAVVGIETPAP